MRFITEPDYAMQVKSEVIKILTSPTDWYLSAKLIRAEQTAIAQIKNRIGKRYDCALIFAPLLPPAEGENQGEQSDTRDAWIVTITIDIALYHLYSQTGMKDIPEHRAHRYQDATDWLKDVGNGLTAADLPTVADSDGVAYCDARIWGNVPEIHKW
jgi:Protein of unknown function (DUF1320)